MFELELTLFKFNRNYLRMLVADLAESDMQSTPFAGANPPVWILGHLAMSTDFAGGFLGLEPACPPAWHKVFAPGSKPADLKPPLPTKAELMEAIENGYRRVAEAAPTANPETMNEPHGIEMLAPTVLKTKGDVMGHLMTTHFAFHLAQLSACRRVAGKGPIV